MRHAINMFNNCMNLIIVIIIIVVLFYIVVIDFKQLCYNNNPAMLQQPVHSNSVITSWKNMTFI
jgi:hypothetical protein